MEKNNKKELRDKMRSLIDENGPVYVWKTGDLVPSKPVRFSTVENAKKFVSLRNDFLFFMNMPESTYGIGTEENYKKAQRDLLMMKQKKQVQDYSAYVDENVKTKFHEIKALNALQDVCQKFDGKVINKRFTDAVSAASGLRVSFAEGYECVLDMQYIGNYYAYDLKPYVRIAGSKKREYNYEGHLLWQWGVGDRLDASKVADIIAPYINERLTRIDELNATKKQFSAYLNLAKKAAKLIKELNEYDRTLQAWARNNYCTDANVYASRVWFV